MSHDNLHILTGAPGTGKTAVLEHRGFRYFDTVGEPAREILSERRVPGRRGGFSGPAEEFQSLLLERSILKHEIATARGSALTLFDRGIPDCIAYALYAGVEPGPSIEAARTYRYAPEVFLCTPWEDIYTTDFDRTMTYEMTVEFHERILEAYDIAAYEVIEMPRTRLVDRVEFVIDHLEAREAISRLR
jgi:predicted ATPase